MTWLLWISLAIAGEEVITLNKGEKAPFSGTLISPEATAKLLSTGESELQKCQAQAKRDLALQEAGLVLKFKSKEAEFVACTYKSVELEKIYKEQIKFLERRATTPAWEKPVLFGGGVIFGAGIIALSAWTLDKINR